jgi:hypothetical protein
MMRNHAPPTHRKFATVWEEVEYLRQKLLYWYYGQGAPAKARPYGQRLKRLLKKADAKGDSILGQECRALVCELENDYAGAIRHRENEIRKIRRLHALTPKEDWDWVCAGYDFSDLSDRLDLLAMLYDGIGQTQRAIRILRESKALCARHGIPFDGKELLEELLNDPPRNGKRNGHIAGRAR